MAMLQLHRVNYNRKQGIGESYNAVDRGKRVVVIFRHGKCFRWWGCADYAAFSTLFSCLPDNRGVAFQ